MTVEELKKAAGEGTIDTVLLAIADMEGRLQGKRLTAAHFIEDVLEHGAEGCNYLLAVDVDMETVGGYAMSSWDKGYGDFEMVPDLDSLRPIPWLEGTAMVMADLQWGDGSEVVASPRLIEAVTQVQTQVHDMLTAIPVLPRNIEHSNAQHARIVRAVLAGRAASARSVMEEHCDATSALLRGLLG